MQPSSKKILIDYLQTRKYETVLDAPSGGGWLRDALGPDVTIDGIDLYESEREGYRNFWGHDLDTGLPKGGGPYDLICCCEGLEHVGSPLLLLRDCHEQLAEEGELIITTPNVWYPQARLQYWARGFFPSFPPLADKVRPGSHMHITPWTWPQLYAYLTLADFSFPEILEERLSDAKHLHERLLALPTKSYCCGKARKAKSDEERHYWQTAGSNGSVLGRHLMVTCRKIAKG